ncbi:SDR family NAD(P)-dependent oxidoreductase [Janthinobacterium fluminis]|uniref:SDR family NAD(P)-dependent oxidoreductase n=1 Tax=Janthinobacterium fluminis TaxID=2987524 RepID=A0ABT5K0D2_9BURK|nr:SDR family NAD(P)-dependent oxidoreductase [Janthinobacterium fluminis]MDC8758420.1 SDR family NAD(P)-dependent oxidoreductase [Janthinobacterium fluminis]
MNFLQYVLEEVKSRRVSHHQALELVRQYQERAAVSAPAPLHPLAQRNTSTQAQQRYSATFSGDEFFFADHLVHGQRILPGAAHLELARAAVAAALELDGAGCGICLEGVVFLRPVVVHTAADGAAAPLQVHISLSTLDGGTFEYRIHGDDEALPYSQGRAMLLAQDAAPALDLDALAAHAREETSAQRHHELHTALGFHYGPQFDLVDRVRTGSDAAGQPWALGDLDQSRAQRLETGFALHPGMMDCALQVSTELLMSVQSGDEQRLALPFAMERVEILAPLPARARVLARLSPGTDAHGAVQKVDVQIGDENGAVCVRLSGFSSRVLDSAAAGVQAAPEMPGQDAAQAAQSGGEGEDGELLEKVQRALTQEVSTLLKLPLRHIALDAQLTEFGFDSISQTTFGNQLNKKYGLALSPTQFFETTTLDALAHHLVQAYRAQMAQVLHVAAPVNRLPAAPAAQAARSVAPPQRLVHAAAAKAAPEGAPEPVAVIGMSGVFPLAEDLAALWENLRNGRDCITEVPQARWDWDKLAAEFGLEPGVRINSRAGVIDSLAEFDPLFFRISPREALTMDPQQRLLMTYVWKAVEDAGYSAQSLAGSKTALFVGTGSSGYARLVVQARTAIEGYSTAGTVPSMGPNRASYWMDWHGPSEPIDTACSSALVAIHRAVALLQMGQCELALVGGVNTLIGPEAQISFSKAGMLGEDGRCKTFSKDANGYVRGEGAGMLMLKPLSAAERDGDHIYGLILGSSENHGGKASSLTAPNPRAQADLIKEAFDRAGVDPATVGYVEAHGTGTPLGDPIEVQGLQTAFAELAQRRGGDVPQAAYCGLGSIKTNIGHLELAAGVAGVIKVLLQMQHKTLVPSLHSAEINPYIQLEGSPFYIVRETQPWKVLNDARGNPLPRRAGVSSFGFGGVNAHVVLQEYIAQSETRADAAPSAFLIVLSARNEERLQDQARQLLQAIECGRLAPADLADLSYTLQVGRDGMEMRLACVVGTLEELREKLNLYLQGDPAIDQLYLGEVKRHKETLSAFASDLELQEAIVKWIQRGKLDKLADHWVKGLNYDWKQLYGDCKPRRISLPTYPFAREQYWPAGAEPTVAANGAMAAVLHPLAQRNTSDFFGQRYSTTFTGAETFLSGHLVQGKRVLPGVVYLEMARAALIQAGGLAGDAGLRLKEVAWAEPLVVEAEPVEVHIGLYPEEGGAVGFEMYSGEERVHSLGTMETFQPGAAERLDLAALRAQCGAATLVGGDCYARFAALGLAYGPAQQAIEAIHVGAGQALARLQLPAGVLDHVLTLSLLDAGLQAVACLAGDEQRGQPALPFTVETVEIVGRCTPQMWALVKAGGDSTAQVCKYDVTLCDDEGAIVVRFQGFAARAVEGQPGAGSVLLLRPEWRRQPAQGAAPQYQERHAVLCGVGVAAPALQERMTGAACVELAAGSDLAVDYSHAVQRLCAAVKAILQGKPAGPVLLQVVVPAEGPRQALAGLAGLLRTARQELPKLVGQLIAVGSGVGADALAAMLAANAACPQDVVIRHVDGQREVADWEEMTAEAAAPPPWKADGVYLLTGGLGGLGQLFATEIARRARGVTLVLTGRRELDDAGRQHVRALEALGATVAYRALDVADREAVRQLVLQVREEYQGLHGIVHAAGVLRDSLLLKKTPEEVEAVLAPKVAGLLHLDEASRDVELDWLICFSSTSAALGNAGQADYAAANGFLDSYAHYRNGLAAQGLRHGRTVSVNWPLWKEGGMQVDAATLQVMEQVAGLVPLASDDGLQALYRICGGAGAQAMVLSGVAGRIRQRLLARPERAVRDTAAPMPATGDAELLEEKIRRLLLNTLSTLLKMPAEDIDGEAELSEFGLDSVMLTEFNKQLNREYGIALTPTIFYEYPTLNRFAGYLAQENHAVFAARLLAPAAKAAPETAPETTAAPAPARLRRRFRPAPALAGAPAALRPAAPEPIAIIGMSGCFPMARDLDEFWDRLVGEQDCISEIPASRWDWRKSYGDPATEENKTNVKWGGFIDGVDEFDPLFFGISPKEAEMMDPQQRLLMTHVWKAIEDAGYAAGSLSGSRTALYVGTGAMGYGNLLDRAQLVIEGYSATGVVPSVGPNRMSYLLNLHGPSEPVETACSSSLVALRKGVMAIENGGCELAIVGGINTLVTPEAHISLGKAGMLCEDGRCKTFSAQANGYVRGEGVGMLVLKRLSAAERDGDHIYGLIRGTAENHGGRATSLTAPNPNAQADLLKEAYQAAGVDPRSVGYIEAHGTGTPLGDPIEVNGLKMAFKALYQDAGAAAPDAPHCALGSVKSNIGHLELAAGVAGVIKVLLQLRHKTLVGSLHCDEVNPYIDLQDSPFYLARQSGEWPALHDGQGRELPRRAGVSSFGFGGVNAHVVIEEYVGVANTRPARAPDGAALVLLSAKNAERLQAQAQQLLAAIEANGWGDDRLAELAYTLQVGREAMEERLALVVDSMAQLKERLAAFVAGQSGIADLFRGQVKRNKEALAVFGADEDMARAIEAWIAKGKLHKLVDLWVKGLAFDWSKLYGEQKPIRMSLPTYPFARERYWVPPGAAQPPAEVDGGLVALHPLVQRNTSDLSEQRFSTRLTGNEFFLADHVVQGKRVLPGVAYLEMAREAIRLAVGRQGAPGITLSHVVWGRPIVVEDTPADVHIALLPEDNGGLSYEIYSEAGGERLLHSQGRAATGAAGAPLTLDLARLRQVCTEEVPAAQLYARFRRQGLAYGPAHQALTALYRGEGTLLARLELPPAVAATASRFHLHPSLLDGALQALLGFAPEEQDGMRTALPFALQELQVLGDCGERMWAVARPSQGSQAQDTVQKFDLDLCKDDGAVCVRLNGFTTRVLENASAAGATLLLRPEWRADAGAAAEAPAYARHLVLLCDSRVDAAELSGSLDRAQCLHLPDGYVEQAESVLAHLQTLLQDKGKAPLLVQLVVPAFGPQQVAAGLAGLLKTARLEHPKLIGQLIALDEDNDAGALALKLRANSRRPQDVQIRYVEAERQVLGWSELADTAAQRPWKAGGVYLITGGLGGLGLIFAQEIARQAPGATLVLTGRRALDSAGRQVLRELEAAGARADYRAVDVADYDAVRWLVLQACEDYAGLHGIVHAAGVIRDGLLAAKTGATLREVLSGKVSGLINLDEASRDIELDCFICFSSLAAVHGNVGQADYAAGNAFMDSYATYRNGLVALGQRRGHTLSVNWPLWQQGGMQVGAATVQAMTRATGMLPLRSESGIDALYRALGSGLSQVAVAEGDAGRMRQVLLGAPAPHAPPPPPVKPAAPSPEPAAAGQDAAALRLKAGHYLRKLLAGTLHLPAQQVEIDAPLEKYGIDSIMVMSITVALERVFGPLSKTLLFEYQTLQALADYFVEQHLAQLSAVLDEPAAPPAAVAAPASDAAAAPFAAPRTTARRFLGGTLPQPAQAPVAKDDIAIIGVAGRYPQARDLAAYWDNLRKGVDCISEIPRERWDHTAYFDPDKNAPGKTYTKWGGFIDGVDEFDPLFFNLLPRDAELADPQERLFLQCAYAAMEDAGYTREMLERYQAQGMKGNVGVYVGVMYEEYQLYAAQQQQRGNALTVSANPASIANRVSYFLNLHGPSMAVDTMCSSSLTALHLACESLQRGGCEMAIAGGVNVSIHPNKYLMLGQGRFASSKGQCESFGLGGDGYVPGEGVGAVILKPLSRALADGDHIHGVIRATSINHGGKTNGYTVPNPLAQAKVIAGAIKAAGIEPRTISYIEAHGTGTSLGDPIEITGLSKAFAEYTSDRQFCAIGSVKSNIGHGESAAGIAALTKVLLQMRHGQLVPSLHSATTNPNIDFARTPFVVQQELAEWRRPLLDIDGVRREYPRIAGISSFGAGGANAHVIVEEWPAEAAPGYAPPAGQPLLVVLSAKQPERLLERARQLLEALERGEVTQANLADAAYTLQVGRAAMDARLALAVDSLETLRDKLRQVLQGDEAVDEVYRGDARRHKDEMWLLTADEDMQAMLAGWVAKGRHGRLLELWTKGLNFDWNSLYGPDDAPKPRRISLPTYPFARERYWLPVGPAAAPPAIAAQAAALHPLVQRNTSSFAEQRFSSSFDGREFFLADHQVQGRKVLPGVAYLEMARAAMEQAGGMAAGDGLRFRNVVWSRPLVVDDQAVALHIRLHPEQTAQVVFTVYGDDGDAAAYSRGTLEAFALAAPERIDLAALRAQCGRAEWRSADCYARFAQGGLQYGAAHQGIDTLYLGEGRVLARLVLPAPLAATRQQFGLHPSLLDAALQALIGLGPQEAGGAPSFLPFALEQLEVLGACEERMWAVASFSPGSRPGDRVQKFDLDLCDDDGRICVRFKGFSTRALEAEPGRAAGAGAIETVLLRPEWRAAPAPAGAAPVYSGHLVLLCDSQMDAAALAACLPAARCEHLPDDYAGQAERLLLQLQALLRAQPGTEVLVQVVVPEFGPQQAAAGLAGLLKSARLEHAKLVGQLVIVDREDDAAQLAAKLRESAGCPQDTQIRYGEGERQVLAWADLADNPPLLPWQADGVYLITGGLGGLGRVFAMEIAKQVRGATLVLTGRRELDEAGRQQLRALEACGATVEYRAVDVADREALRRLLLQVQEDHAGLNGILHSAGVLRDSLLLKKTRAELEAVLAPKVAGLVNLDEASRDMALDCFICFSSISAVRGNIGQADYAAGNGFMDAYAAYRNSLVAIGQRQGQTLSVNWPLWQEGGMRIDAATERAMRQMTGMVAMRSDAGIAALYRAFGSGLDQVAVLEGDPGRVRRLLADAVPAAVAGAAAPGAPAAASAALIERKLIGMAAALAKVAVEMLDGETELHEYGFDSIMATELGNRLNQEYRLDLAPTVFFEHPTLGGLARYLSSRHAANFGADPASPAPPMPAAAAPSPPRPALPQRLPAAAPAAPASGPEPIAIIGLSGRFPQADDVEALWQNLKAGRDCITEVPPERWDIAAYFDPQKGLAGKSYTRWGGFINGIEQFDALFFNISPREAQALDVQTRLFLQTVWTLLEAGGHTRESLRQQYQGQVGVYVGAMPQAAALPAGDPVLTPMATASGIANRVSHFFNFEGPSIAIDTMCSSAMMAIHLACRDLQQGECRLAVVGGINLSLSPQKFVSLSQVQLVGSHPACRSFTDGDGHLSSETVGAVLLKPLRLAIADGDAVLAVIKGTATQHSGRSTAYGAANPNAQARVIEESLRRAGAAPASIGYIEAAAAGLALADAIEVAALNKVFAAAGGKGWRCPMGAVKSGLGHPEMASGIAQLAKVVLQLQHRELAPLVAVGAPNRQLRLDETPFYLQHAAAAWEPLQGPGGQGLPRRALINSFGAGGTYVSAVIEEFVAAPAQPEGDVAAEAQLFVFSARSAERLQAVLGQALLRLEGGGSVVLRDLAYTLQAGREPMDCRLAVVATTRQELIGQLRAGLDGRQGSPLSLHRSVDAGAAAASPRLPAGVLDGWLVEGNLDGLAAYWAQGGVVPWARLHAGRAVRKIAWPTYPLAPTSYPLGAAVLAPAQPLPAAPANGAAASIVDAVAIALGIPAVELPMHQPLHTLGYNSIAALELKQRLEAALRRPVALALLADGQRSIEALLRSLEMPASDAGAATAIPASSLLPQLIPQAEARHEPFPLTDMQQSYLLGRKSTLDGDRIGAHLYLEIEVGGALNIFRLNQAWNRLVARHDMLRAVVGEDGRQRILPTVRDYRFKVLDLRRQSEAERRGKADRLRETMEHHVFAGAAWPLFDIRVAIGDEGRHRIHFSIDELIVDGLSLELLLRQWAQLYADPALVLPDMELLFRDYVLAMQAFEASDRYRQDLAYWLERLRGMPGGPLLARPGAGQAADGARRRTRLAGQLAAPHWQVLKAKAAALNVSPTSLMLGIFVEVLRTWAAEPSFTLVLTYFNRPPLHPQIRELIGPAISSLLFVVEAGHDADLAGILQAHHQRLWEDLEHSAVGGIQALRQLRGRGGRAVPATLPVVFTSMLGGAFPEPAAAPLGEVVYSVNQTPQVYLDHQLRESAGGLEYSWDVAEGYFESGLMRTMFAAYAAILEGLAAGRLAWTLASFAPAEKMAAVDADPATAQLAAFLAEAQGEDPLAPFQLTDQQQAYAVGRDKRLEGGGSSCQFYQELLAERLDVARLDQALAALIARHPMLRTVVQADGSQALLAQAPRYTIAVDDLRRHSREQRQAALAATRQAQLGRAVPLGEWPYFAVSVSLLEADKASVHLCFDLMLVDSTSIGQLLLELLRLYQQPQAALPPPGLSFRDYQRAVARFKGTQGHAERLAYWNRKFADLPAGPALPQLPATAALAGHAHQRISGELQAWGALKQYAAANGVAPGLIALTAYLEVLYAWNGQRPLAVVVPGWERLPVHPDIERVVGDFTALSWSVRESNMIQFAIRLKQVARQHADDLAQRPVSGLQALRRVMLRDRQRPLRFPVVFTNQVTPLTLRDAQFVLGEALSKTPQVYLDNLSSEAGSRLLCSWDFAGDVYAPAMVREMFDGYLRLLELLGSDPLAWQRSDFGDVIRARPAAYGEAADLALAT